MRKCCMHIHVVPDVGESEPYGMIGTSSDRTSEQWQAAAKLPLSAQYKVLGCVCEDSEGLVKLS